MRPNGTAVDFNGQVFNKVVAKAKKLKFRAMTFTLPEVQTESIIEYSYKLRWRKKAPKVLRHPERYIVTGAHSLPTDRWIVQHELSTRRARFSIRPIPSARIKCVGMSLPKGAALRSKPDGTIDLEVENIPAFQAEEYMPPEDVLKSRVDCFYTLGYVGSPERFWRQQAERQAEGVEKFIGKSNAIKRAVAKLIQPDDPPETKLRKLYARVLPRGLMREKTEKERKRKKLKENKNVEDVLKHRYGSHDDFNKFFVALARAAGFDAAIVLVPRRRNHFFREKVLDASQLDAQVVMVRLGKEELYLAPGTPYTPFGLLLWDLTRVKGFRVEKEGGVIVAMPEPPSADALTERRATLQLGEDGSLTGKVQVVFHGQDALKRRLAAIEEDKAGRRKQLEEEVKGWFPAGAEVEIEKVSNWEDPEEPLRVESTVEVAEFAVSTGRRLILPLAIFQANEKHPFPHAKRIHPIYFPYPWQEVDEITVQLSEGYKVESLPEKWTSMPRFGGYEISYENQGRTLRLQRRFAMGGILFRVGQYPSLRLCFDAVRRGDEQQVVLQAVESDPEN